MFKSRIVFAHTSFYTKWKGARSSAGKICLERTPADTHTRTPNWTRCWHDENKKGYDKGLLRIPYTAVSEAIAWKNWAIAIAGQPSVSFIRIRTRLTLKGAICMLSFVLTHSLTAILSAFCTDMQMCWSILFCQKFAYHAAGSFESRNVAAPIDWRKTCVCKQIYHLFALSRSVYVENKLAWD